MMKFADAIQEKDGVEKNGHHVEDSLLSKMDGSKGTREDHLRMLDACDSKFRWVVHVLHSLFIKYTTHR